MAVPLKDRRSWSRDSIDPAGSWYYPLSGSCWALLAEARQKMAGADGSAWMGPPADSVVQNLRAELRLVREELEQGRGFAIVTGLPASLTPAEKEQAYWFLGHGLGTPVVQNVQQVLLYDVRDAGQDVRLGARFSVTNSESSFHTDNSFGLSVADYVGLLCLQTARSGGVSQMVNGFRVAEELAKRAQSSCQYFSKNFASTAAVESCLARPPRQDFQSWSDERATGFADTYDFGLKPVTKKRCCR